MAKAEDIIQAALGHSAGGGGSVAEELQKILLKKYQKEIALEEEREAQQLAARKQNAMAMESRRQQEFATQSQCPHMKPNFQSAVGGQRDHQGNHLFICAYCAKEWRNNELPAHLRIPADRVGGPQV